MKTQTPTYTAVIVATSCDDNALSSTVARFEDSESYANAYTKAFSALLGMFKLHGIDLEDEESDTDWVLEGAEGIEYEFFINSLDDIILNPTVEQLNTITADLIGEPND